MPRAATRIKPSRLSRVPENLSMEQLFGKKAKGVKKLSPLGAGNIKGGAVKAMTKKKKRRNAKK